MTQLMSASHTCNTDCRGAKSSPATLAHTTNHTLSWGWDLLLCKHTEPALLWNQTPRLPRVSTGEQRMQALHTDVRTATLWGLQQAPHHPLCRSIRQQSIRVCAFLGTTCLKVAEHHSDPWPAALSHLTHQGHPHTLPAVLLSQVLQLPSVHKAARRR